MVEQEKKVHGPGEDGKAESDYELLRLILGAGQSKYSLVELASAWAKHIKKREEFRNVMSGYLIDIALKDILSGKVTWNDIDKLSKSDSAKESKKKSEEPAEPEAKKDEKDKKDKKGKKKKKGNK